MVRTFVTTYVKTLESGDIESNNYSLNITKDKCRDRVFSIVTGQGI